MLYKLGPCLDMQVSFISIQGLQHEHPLDLYTEPENQGRVNRGAIGWKNSLHMQFRPTHTFPLQYLQFKSDQNKAKQKYNFQTQLVI